MKLKIKILKENKQKLSEGRYDGLYDVAGIYPGSIDLFIKHFAEVPIEISMDRKDFIESSFGQEIEALRDEDIPRTSARSSKTPLDKVKNALRRGHTYWWNEIFEKFKIVSRATCQAASRRGDRPFTTPTPCQHRRSGCRTGSRAPDWLVGLH